TPLGVVSDPSQAAYSDLGLLPQWRTILAERTQNFGSSWIHAFDRGLNELRISFSRIASERGPLDADPRSRGLPAVTIENGDPAGFAGLPSSGFAAAGSLITFGSDSRSALFNSNLYQLQENLSFIHGRQSLKFGANFLETRSDFR